MVVYLSKKVFKMSQQSTIFCQSLVFYQFE